MPNPKPLPQDDVDPGMRRRPGRPRGSRTRLLRDARPLGRHHFAFLRAVLQGLDPRQAWKRYLAFGEAGGGDARRAARMQRELLKQVQDDALALKAGGAAAGERARAVAALSQPAGGRTVALPDLQAFAQAQELDAADGSEAELLRAYREHHGLDTLPDEGARPVAPNAALQALARLEPLLARSPDPDDPVALWFAAALARRLEGAGLKTLQDLVRAANALGPRWHRRVPGLGAARAAGVLDWLRPASTRWGEPLQDAAQAPRQRSAVQRRAALAAVLAPPRFALVPLERFAAPSRLAGGASAPGRFATRMPNHLGATDDRHALEAWLLQYADQPATLRAYRKEAERFYLWCLLERGKPLSSVDSVDCAAYRDFLRHPPPGWCCDGVVPRDDDAWRPFRGPLQPASQRAALVVVQALFDGLRDANYLVGNPMRAVSTKAALPAARIGTERSFGEREWRFVRERLDAEEAALAAQRGSAAAAPQRRLRLVLELLAGTGLRLAEIASASTAALRCERLPGLKLDAWLLTVQGKGGKRREVPLAEDLRTLLARHHADAAARGPLPDPVPLVCTLAAAPPAWSATTDGRLALAQPSHGPQALGASGLYRMLKRFFTRIAAEAHAVDGLDAARFQAASTHWLRHTFARQGAAAQVPVEVLQQALGHASLATTTLYLSTERVRMVQELERLHAQRQQRRE